MDPQTGEPHLHRHGVTEEEVEHVLGRPIEDRLGTGGARVVVGQAPDGRYLRVVYVPDPDPRSVFVITAYELGPKARRALQRRCRRKR